MEMTDEYEALARILATMRDRIARGDARARVIAGVVEEMMAEREERLTDDLKPRPASQEHGPYPL